MGTFCDEVDVACTSFCIAICWRCCPIVGAAASVTSGGVHLRGISELCDEPGWSWECCVELEDEVNVSFAVAVVPADFAIFSAFFLALQFSAVCVMCCPLPLLTWLFKFCPI